MKAKRTMILTLLALIFGTTAIDAQVTIGSDTYPQATLDVVATKTDGSTAEGIMAPRLTLAQLKAADTQYTAAQTGALVYVMDATGGTTTKTANITAAGYYYFDGTLWHSVSGVDNNTLYEISYESSTSLLTLTPSTGGGSPVAIALPKDIASNGLTKIGNDVQLGGHLTKNTTVAQGEYGFAFTGIAPTIINSPFRYSNYYASPGEGKVLFSDSIGNATWRDIARNYAAGDWRKTDTTWLTRQHLGYTYTGMNVEIPSGKSIIKVGQLINNKTNYNGYVALLVSTDSITYTSTGISYFPRFASYNMSAKSHSTDQIEFDVVNSSSQPVRVYIWACVNGLGGMQNSYVPDINIIDASHSFGIVNAAYENFIAVYWN